MRGRRGRYIGGDLLDPPFRWRRSYNILFGAIFLPIALLFSAHATYVWMRHAAFDTTLPARLFLPVHQTLQLDIFLVLSSVAACTLCIYGSGNSLDALFMGGTSVVLLTSVPVVFYYLEFFRVDRVCIALIGTCASMIAIGTGVSFQVNDDVNVRVVLGAVLYPAVYATTVALLVWRAKFWRFAFDVKVRESYRPV
jgi:hypothetical protein